MRLMLSTFVLAALMGCEKDESLSAFVPEGAIWHLTELDGAPFAGHATLTFPKPGELVGQAPCNRYVTTQNAPYPWFEAGAIGATKMACAALQLEHIYFEALSRVTLAEVSGNTLILSTETGPILVFEVQ